MNIKTSLTILTTTQLALIAASIWCVRQADKAMDKAGIGNLELNQQYNSYAGKAISIAVVLWIAAALLAVFCKSIKESYFQIVIAVPPLVLIVSWLLLLIL